MKVERKRVTFKLVKITPFTWQVIATSTVSRHIYTDNPVGLVEQQPDGYFKHSSLGSRAGVVFGHFKTKEAAARACVRAHRDWVSY